MTNFAKPAAREATRRGGLLVTVDEIQGIDKGGLRDLGETHALERGGGVEARDRSPSATDGIARKLALLRHEGVDAGRLTIPACGTAPQVSRSASPCP